MTTSTTQERRGAARVEFQGRVELDATDSGAHLTADSVNVSEGGICLRVPNAMEIRSSVMLRLFTQPRRRPVECAGRVAWVTQRSDLRDAPPFIYDIGVEFIKPSARLRQFASRIGVDLKPTALRNGSQARAGVALRPAALHGRSYIPKLTQESTPASRWHLVVTVDGAPCFSRRYASAQEAREAWKQFKKRGGH